MKEKRDEYKQKNAACSLDLGLQKCVPRGFLTEVAVQGDYARYENTTRERERLPRASNVVLLEEPDLLVS